MPITLDNAIEFIEQASDYEINEIMEAIRRRFAAAFPDWEVIYLSCPKDDPIQRTIILEMLIQHFRA